ncbi:hypothetical protein TRFO_11869 [Tritrichomonas foetus]|uniref:Uncharacterized protein n=1 Tax=Tritrichomonas foetus TaxID=1144522 RepID=A0A1J4J3W1_9EUKA|nr:hypothetical protein TRFO_11869 [Tritrichomonas foetus]|eukprot:OHS93433.1 hypothetical protein TRFO_11869 [Tritrichomonas foetus]
MSFESWSYGKRMRDTPGPGAYSVPSSFGDGPKYTFQGRPKEKIHILEPPILLLPSTLSSHRTSFGGRTRTPPMEETPGPLDIRGTFGKDLPKISFHGRHELPVSDVPPPTAYNVPRSFDTRPIKILNGPRTDLIDHRPRPKPGTYFLPSDFDSHKQLTIGPVLPPPELDNGVPGPGQYNAYKNLGSEAPKYSFPKDTQRDRKNSLPGPAEYNSSSTNLDTHGKVPFSIGKKSRPPLKFEPLGGDTHDYPYVNIGGTMIPKSVTIGYRPETCYETVSPGPGYSSKSSFELRKISIGNLTKIQDGENCAPSPDHYFKAPFVVPRTEPFKGFNGPISREPEEIKRDKWVPSPGDYSVTRDLDKPKACFKFNKAEKLKEYKADTTAPYSQPTSSLGGPRFTIGRKTE